MTDDREPHRMSAAEAELLSDVTKTAFDGIDRWRARNRDVADWRVEEAHSSLRRAVRYLGYLRDDIDPEGDAARMELMKYRPELFEKDVPRETSAEKES